MVRSDYESFWLPKKAPGTRKCLKIPLPLLLRYGDRSEKWPVLLLSLNFRNLRGWLGSFCFFEFLEP